MPIDVILARLDNVSGGPDTFYASCPAHPDSRPSLAVTESDEAVLLIHCHRGCQNDEILRALDLTFQDLYPSPYALEFGQRQSHVATSTRIIQQAGEVILPSREDLAAYREIHRAARSDCRPRLRQLAHDLELPFSSLNAIRVGCDKRGFIFPERDGTKRIVGLVCRRSDGSRKCLPGSVRGITIPMPFNPDDGPIYLAEGATDTAALLSVGLNAIGRPAARTSHAVQQFLIDLLADYPDRELVVIGDNDKLVDGIRAGAEGASKLAERLNSSLPNSVLWALPKTEFKDIREQITRGAWSHGLRFKELKHD